MEFLWAIAFSLLLSFPLSNGENNPSKPQTFIVSIKNDLKPPRFTSVEHWYKSILNSIATPSNSSTYPNVLYVYKIAFHGFSARLTSQQTRQLKSNPAVHCILPDPVYQLHTTRSPQFLGLSYDNSGPITPTNLIKDSDQGSNVVVGILDTGIWPERSSFNDREMPPVPAHWKGECEGGGDFPKHSCNKKIVGARYFNSGFQTFMEGRQNTSPPASARDDIGHGTHTASTAAGRAVRNASLLGFATGEARGVAPKARIAVYRVCWEGCLGSDILAALDKAIEDGVDVISLSLGGGPMAYTEDPIATGAFNAVERGIFVSTSASNDGPEYMSVTNVAPWLSTIGAGSIDRNFPADITLETGEVIKGVSLYDGKSLDNEFYPLYYAGENASEVVNTCTDSTAFERDAVRGKIVVCLRGYGNRVEKGLVVQKLGAVGVVVANPKENGEGLLADPHIIPGLDIPYSATKRLLSYINSTQNPKAKLNFRGTQLNVNPAPVVASFSSRGPNPLSRHILKPDVIAPGVSILAGWPDHVSVSMLPEDKRMTQFNILSGTSMSCPHVSGVAALLKAAHPNWSPAMIRSALMTTAHLQDRYGKPLLDEFDYNETTIWDTGAGHVNPEKANDPGLVYDITIDDYVEFLCASNYSKGDIGKIAKRKVRCGGSRTKPWDLNYPAIVVYSDGAQVGSELDVVVRRSVTNVGKTVPSRYNVEVRNPRGATVTVDPASLEFKNEGETRSFEVRVSAKKDGWSWFEVGGLVWSDGTHYVNSPIVVQWGAPV